MAANISGGWHGGEAQTEEQCARGPHYCLFQSSWGVAPVRRSEGAPAVTGPAALRINNMLLLILILTAVFPMNANAQIIFEPPCQQPFDPRPSCNPTPTRDPVILAPGLLISFSMDVIIQDQANTENWGFVPLFGNIYRGLIERLESAGYEQGTDLFIAHYDWRQSNAESAIEYLIPAIERAKAVSGSEKVDIIAHSMGGLVARQYVRSAQFANDVDQLILLGTPSEGAADAYVAWEGGEFPDRWGQGTQWYIRVVELALRHYRNVNFDRPLSFRAFFPSLRDLLPITDYISRDGIPLAIESLTEQNPFLQQLEADLALIGQRGVRVVTIAGTDHQTLGAIPLSSNRTQEDITRERWRDGRPNPNPPATDTAAGDQTVLVSSVHITNNTVTIPNVSHQDLPEEAQEEVLAALALPTSGTHIAYEMPNTLAGVLVLSPIEPKITGPNGEMLSSTENSFAMAEYVADDDPEGPKLLVIGDPPPGRYTVMLTGTSPGPFTAITACGSESALISSERTGTTTVGQKDTYTFFVGQHSCNAPSGDLLALLNHLSRTIKHHWVEDDKDDSDSSPIEQLAKIAERMRSYGKAYVRSASKRGFDNSATKRLFNSLDREFDRFSRELSRSIARGHLTSAAIADIIAIRDALISAGL